MLLCLVVACIIVGVAVLPAVESCKSTCVGGGSMTPSKVWFGISALAFVGVLTVSWRQRDRKGPSSNAAWMAETLMKYGFPG